MVQGTIIIDQVHCKGCQLCVLFCPKSVIAIDEAQLNTGGYHPALLQDPDTNVQAVPSAPLFARMFALQCCVNL